mmetsp:Transcript_35375/g.75416  ORF Transcript_35375/g.75416 Transcript_35375/m.75416 type:complete len:228 (+) Transcript_35375:2181-2864(+)
MGVERPHASRPHRIPRCRGGRVFHDLHVHRGPHQDEGLLPHLDARRDPPGHDLRHLRFYYSLPRSQHESPQRFPERDGEAGHWRFRNELLCENGHLCLRHVLPHETLCRNAIDELLAIPRDAGRHQHDGVHYVLHRLQPRGLLDVGAVLRGSGVHEGRLLQVLRCARADERQQKGGVLLQTAGQTNSRTSKRKLRDFGRRRPSDAWYQSARRRHLDRKMYSRASGAR